MAVTILEIPKEFGRLGVIVDVPFDDVHAEDLPLHDSTDSDLILSRDRQDMARMGRTIELKRNFDVLSCIGFTSLVSGSWEVAMISFMYTLVEVGTAGTIWTAAVSSIGMISVGLSLAEMASIAPTTGAQYHWVSEFAPQKVQRFLSYFTGWTTAAGWAANLTWMAYITAIQTEVIVTLSFPDFDPPSWRAPLVAILIIIIAILCNTLLIRKMAFLEGMCLMLHVAGFVFVNVVLILMGPRQDAASTLTTFATTTRGYSHLGLACLVGLGPSVAPNVGIDSSCHLAEEVRNASWAVPRAMIVSSIANAVTGFIITTNLVFNISNMYDVVYPSHILAYVTTVLDVTGSRAATYVVVSLLTVLFTACAANRATTASRQLYAFSRDNGLPFSKWLSHVRPGSDLPVNSILGALLISALSSLFLIGSTTAFQIISTLAVNSLILSYLTAIVVFAWRKVHSPKSLPHATFRMGRSIGLAVNGFSIIFLAVAFVFAFFPAVTHANVGSMNWSVLVMGILLLFCVLYWVLYARHQYIAPIERMRKDV